MNSETKIAFLNNLVDGTLCITHFIEWQLGSYGENTLFLHDGSIGYIRASGFNECIDKAFRAAGETIRNG